MIWTDKEIKAVAVAICRGMGSEWSELTEDEMRWHKIDAKSALNALPAPVVALIDAAAAYEASFNDGFGQTLGGTEPHPGRSRLRQNPGAHPMTQDGPREQCPLCDRTFPVGRGGMVAHARAKHMEALIALAALKVAPSPWRPIAEAEGARADGSEILATVAVYRTDDRTLIRWDTHIIAADDETGEIHPEYEQGWQWDDYTHWQPLPLPPGDE